jgi:hypothetical protein
VNEVPELSPELREAAKQIPIVITWLYDSVFAPVHQLLQILVEAAEREGLICGAGD